MRRKYCECGAVLAGRHRMYEQPRSYDWFWKLMHTAGWSLVFSSATFLAVLVILFIIDRTI